MKRMLILCVILSCLCAFASADVWVQETWEHWNDTLDCDGVPLIVDADVLILPEGTTGAEYTLQSLSAQETKTIRDTTDWAALGFQANDLIWRVDGSYRWTDGGPTAIRIGPYNDVCISNEEATAINRFMLNDTIFRERNQSKVNESPLSQFSFDAVETCAVTTAQQLGFMLGSLRRMTRWDAEMIRAYWTYDITEYVGELDYATDYSASETPFDLSEPLEDIEFFEVFYPVYYQGLRLYSGVSPALPGEAHIEDLSLYILYDVQGISLLEYPVFGGFTKTGKEAALMDARDAIVLLRNAFANMYLPGVKQITLQSVSMDYTPFTGDLLAKTGYTLYPMWNMCGVMEYEDGTSSLIYNGFHAVTGKQIY